MFTRTLPQIVRLRKHQNFGLLQKSMNRSCEQRFLIEDTIDELEASL
jgi:hypothetical protein